MTLDACKVGYLIRRERLRARMSQAELARRAGTAQTAISRLETNEISPTLRTLERIIEATGAVLIIDAKREEDE